MSLFILAAILNKFPLPVDKSVTWFLLCASVFSPTAAILESEKTLGTRLPPIYKCLRFDLLIQWNWKQVKIEPIVIYQREIIEVFFLFVQRWIFIDVVMPCTFRTFRRLVRNLKGGIHSDWQGYSPLTPNAKIAINKSQKLHNIFSTRLQS